MIAAAPACNEELACGPGTHKQDGYCLADTESGTDGSSGDSSSGSATNVLTNASAGDDEDDGGSAFTTGPDGPAPYAACYAGSDAECRGDEACVDAISTCAESCSEDQHCGDPADGTAVQRCEATPAENGYTLRCVLYCGVDGATCPTGMVCRPTELCMESSDDGGSSTGYYGSSGDECEVQMLEICVWE